MNKTNEIIMLDVILWTMVNRTSKTIGQNSKYQLAKKHIDRV